jgi:hypothetical protein
VLGELDVCAGVDCLEGDAHGGGRGVGGGMGRVEREWVSLGKGWDGETYWKIFVMLCWVVGGCWRLFMVRLDQIGDSRPLYTAMSG